MHGAFEDGTAWQRRIPCSGACPDRALPRAAGLQAALAGGVARQRPGCGGAGGGGYGGGAGGGRSREKWLCISYTSYWLSPGLTRHWSRRLTASATLPLSGAAHRHPLACEDFIVPFPQVIIVGQCIYCGATDDLRREHIVPAALNGDFVLHRATCRRCAGITSAFERVLLRDSFARARAWLRLRTRRTNSRPTSAPVNIDSGSGLQPVSVPIDDYPATIVLPQLDPPKLGDTPCGFRIKGFHLLQLGSFQQVVPQLGASASMVEPFKPLECARLLSKIGYGFAVAKFGVPHQDEVFILRSVLGDVDDLCNWVGEDSTKATHTKPSDLHSVVVQIEQPYIVAYVRLFGMFGGPEYKVVVGRARANRPL